jgi:mono/diheme cytochrome c family protein
MLEAITGGEALAEMYKVRLMALVAAGTLLLLSSRAWAQDSAKLFQDKCTACHGDNGKGDGPAAVAYNPRPKDFASPEFWEPSMTEQKIILTIENGHVDMPPMDQNPAQAVELARYLIARFKPKQ